MSYLTEFYEGYLTGLYADCYDQTNKDMEQKALELCKELFDQEVERSITDGSSSIIQSKPNWKVRKTVYALLPAWFLTIRYKDKPYTMIVNGQNGKVIGAVPFVKWKVVVVFLCLLSIFMLFVPKICIWIFARGGWFIKILILFTIGTYFAGVYAYHDFKKNLDNTSANELKKYAGERQEET